MGYGFYGVETSVVEFLNVVRGNAVFLQNIERLIGDSDLILCAYEGKDDD